MDKQTLNTINQLLTDVRQLNERVEKLESQEKSVLFTIPENSVDIFGNKLSN